MLMNISRHMGSFCAINTMLRAILILYSLIIVDPRSSEYYHVNAGQLNQSMQHTMADGKRKRAPLTPLPKKAAKLIDQGIASGKATSLEPKDV